MSVALTFMASRQNAASPTIVLWGGVDAGTTRLVVLLARRRLSPEESDAALAGASAECERLLVPPTADALCDDVSPAGQAIYYAVLAELSDGTLKPVRFRAGPMSQPPEKTLDASSLRAQGAPPRPAPPMPERVAAVPGQPSAPDPMEARRAAQKRAEQVARQLDAPVAAPEVPPASAFPIERFGLRMIGASQTWDGLRLQWEDEGKEAEAFEVVIADHPLAPDEVGELLSGAAVTGAAVRAVSAGQRVVIDNLTPREARGYFAVIARSRAGDRTPVGCVAQGWDECRVGQAPFFDPDALEDVRDLAQGHVREARVQLMLWREEQDAGAWREALRLADEALVVYPGYGPALECRGEVEGSRRR